VIGRIVAVQRTELEQEIANLQAEAGAIEEEIKELVGASPF
jgi:cell division protein FtsB